MSSRSNDVSLREGNPEGNSLKSRAQECLNNLGINCLQTDETSENCITVTASLAILQAVAMLVMDKNDESDQNFSKEGNTIHKVIKFIRSLLEGKSDLIGNEVTILHIIWLKNGLKLDKNIQSLISRYYKCETKILPLVNNNVNAPKLKKKLRKLDQSGRFTEAIRTAVFYSISPQDLLLTSAFHIEMAWREVFLENLKTKRTFHISEDESVEVDLMVQKSGLVSISCDDIKATVLELPLTAHNMSLLVFLPHDNKIDLNNISRNLDAEIFGKLVDRIGVSKPKPVYASLPEFTLKQSDIHFYGTKDSTTSQSESNNTPGCKIFQAAALRVDEYGINVSKRKSCEGVTMTGPAVHDGIKWTYFTATSPFLIMLVDVEFKLIFLAGKVVRPEKMNGTETRKSREKENKIWCCI